MLYPVDAGYRFNRNTGVPRISAVTLPAITAEPDRLYDRLALAVPRFSTGPVAGHYQRLFDVLAGWHGRQCWVERSGASGFFIDQLIAAFPRARYVHLIRDLDATAASIAGPLLPARGAPDGVPAAVPLRRVRRGRASASRPGRPHAFAARELQQGCLRQLGPWQLNFPAARRLPRRPHPGRAQGPAKRSGPRPALRGPNTRPGKGVSPASRLFSAWPAPMSGLIALPGSSRLDYRPVFGR